MSGLAELLLEKGFKVSGSDSKESELTEALVAKGATIYYDQSVSHISADIDVVVYSAAIRPGNADLDDANAKQIPLLTRAELLGQVMRAYDIPIAISGTHGKTTTTSMVSEILMEADVDPTLSVGGILPSIGGNFRIGSGNHFVTEACEYTNSFLSFYPKIEIILNIDEDHLDFFKDIWDIRNSFNRFVQLLPADGLLIINAAIDDLSGFLSNVDKSVIKVGGTSTNPADTDYYSTNLTTDDRGCYSFDVICNLADYPHSRSVKLGVPGVHNVDNALAAIALSDYLGIPFEAVTKVLSGFSGSKRRFEYKGTLEGFTIYDDYAHHPTEIAATLSATTKISHNDLWVIFQPHTYTRTKALMDSFAEVLSKSDHVILPDIYPARETDNLGISSEDLCKLIKELNPKCDCHYIPSFEEIEKFVLQNCTKNDMLITMGAGDVVKIGESLLE